jgi:DNA uptake protein ComE-like DNA-binding protein
MALAGMALILSQQMRIETLAGGNRLAQLQADAIERGGEQFVLAQIDGSAGDAADVCAVSCAAMPVGDGYFWVLAPNPDSPQTYQYQITDEAGKINLNSASLTTLENLPNVTTSIAGSIIAWRSTAGSASNIADNAYYLTLPQPYQCKSAPFESVEELLLVHGVTDPTIPGYDLLFGYDTNHNGVLEAAELNAGGMATQIDAAQNGGLGLFPLVTVFSVEPNRSAGGTARVNINSNTPALNRLLQRDLGSARAAAIMKIVTPPAVRGRPPAPVLFQNIFDFALRVNLTPQEFTTICDLLTTSSSPTLTGMINVNTAPAAVLSCLPGLSTSDAQNLITARQANTSAISDAWVLNVLPHPQAVAIGGMITGRSWRFSADIVGVSGDGRAYKRVRIVADCTQSPPQIIYRKDLTDLGWPLDPAIRTSLRAGHGLPGGIVTPNGGI